MVVPNDRGSIPSAGWCNRNSSGASTATLSSLATWLWAVEYKMRTFSVPPGASGADCAGNMLLAIALDRPLLLKLPANDTFPQLELAIKGDCQCRNLLILRPAKQRR